MNAVSKENAKMYKIIMLVIIFVMLASISFGLYLFIEDLKTRRIPPENIISFSSLEKGSTVFAQIETRTGLEDLAFSDGSLKLSKEQQKKFRLPYKITAKVKTSEGKYYDLAWSIDKIGKYYNVQIDGFSSKDKINFRLNELVVIKNAAFDWSGKMDPHYVLIPDPPTTACAEITGQNNLGFCHVVTGRRYL